MQAITKSHSWSIFMLGTQTVLTSHGPQTSPRLYTMREADVKRVNYVIATYGHRGYLMGVIHKDLTPGFCFDIKKGK